MTEDKSVASGGMRRREDLLDFQILGGFPQKSLVFLASRSLQLDPLRPASDAQGDVDLLEAHADVTAAEADEVQAPVVLAGPGAVGFQGGVLRRLGGFGFNAGDTPLEPIEPVLRQSSPQVDPHELSQKQWQDQVRRGVWQEHGDYTKAPLPGLVEKAPHL